MSEREKIVIIGSGPAGYTAAIYAARANLKPLIIEGLQPGGQLTITTDVENYPGFPKGVMGPDLMLEFRAQAERFGTRIISATVTAVENAKAPFRVVHDGGEPVEAEAVIIATGASAKLLNTPSEKKLFGYGISACATCDGFFYKDKDVIVVGGGDTAMEEANYLTKMCKSVTVVHRRQEFRASKIMVERAQKNPRMRWELDSEVDEFLGEAGHGKPGLTGVRLKHIPSGKTKEVAVHGAFIAIGHKPNTDFLKGKLDMDENGYIRVKPGTTWTNVEGIFASGDAADHVYRQAVTAAGTGCMAAIDAERWLAGRGID
ncbi:MAG: thioredoxin-disulfide reductase [Deltaproteobacteria bacterium]|nr:thioredoxin-disulfide reductase [Deltaproteobacteria bacterium]